MRRRRHSTGSRSSLPRRRPIQKPKAGRTGRRPMMIRATLKCILAAAKSIPAAILLLPLCAAAQSSDPLPPETRLINAAGAPTPTEDDFTIASAQDLVITLTDLEVPA